MKNKIFRKKHAGLKHGSRERAFVNGWKYENNEIFKNSFSKIYGSETA